MWIALYDRFTTASFGAFGRAPLYNPPMNRRFAPAIVLGFVLVAACGDNPNTDTEACGDGIKTGSEQCDDGNSTNGDGCSSTCITETTGPRCGDGVVDVATEQCDDGNTSSGDGCSSTCRTENLCGNGHLDGAETCDDGNVVGNDGCSAQCLVEMNYTCTGEPSVCTHMTPVGNGTCAMPFSMPLTMAGTTYTATSMGDTTMSTNQVVASSCDTEQSSGAANDHVFTFANPVAQKVVITLNSHIDTPTKFDGVIRLMTTACDVTTQVHDNDVGGTPDGCSDRVSSTGTEVLTYTSLAAGTYYIVVDGFGATDVGKYSLTIRAGTGTCGNGIVEAFEGCDDHNTTAADGCSATCTVESGYTCVGSVSVCTLNCGNGVLDAGETCDDHNTTAADGCSATCQTEAGYSCTGMPSTCTFVGGNCAAPRVLALTLTGTSYDGMGMGDTSSSTSEVGGASCDAFGNSGQGPDQTWVFTNPVAQSVTITIVGTSTFDTVLRMMTTACDLATEVPETVPPSDATAVSDGCADRHSSGTSEILNYPNLPAGTYYVLIDGFGTTSKGMYSFTVHGQPTTCGNGTLETGEACDDGNTTAGDGCTSECGIQVGYMCTGAPSVCTSSCGNGTLDVGEECDSSGVANARCTAGCHLVFDTTDTENNNDAAHAQVITSVHHIIKGSLPVGDRDVYQFTLAAPAVVEIESYTSYSTNAVSTSVSALGLKCSVDTLIGIFPTTADTSMDSMATYLDDDDGDGACSYVGPLDSGGLTTQGQLAAGTYLFVVHEYQLDDAINYLIDFKVTP